MKKYFVTILMAIIVGFFLAYFFIKQYDDYKGIGVSSSTEELYFIQYGVFSNKESLEENTISLGNYIYNVEDDKYYVFIGITAIEDNAKKISDYYKTLGYETIIKKYQISNKDFIEQLKTYDEVIKETQDKTALSSVINQVLIKYEEVVINGSKN